MKAPVVTFALWVATGGARISLVVADPLYVRIRSLHSTDLHNACVEVRRLRP